MSSRTLLVLYVKVNSCYKSSIPLSHFWISATCGEIRYFYLVSLLEIDFFRVCTVSLTCQISVTGQRPVFDCGYAVMFKIVKLALK